MTKQEQRAPKALQNKAYQLPRYDHEAECAVIGSIIIDPDAIYEIIGFLVVEHFYADRHRIVYQALLELVEANEVADFVTLCNHLEVRGLLEDVGGAGEITRFIQSVPTSGGIYRYAHIVKTYAARRALEYLGEQIMISAWTEAEIDDAYAKAQTLLAELNTDRREMEPMHMEQVLSGYMSTLSTAATLFREGKVAGLPTHFSDLDHLLNGMMPGDLIVLGGRPGTGKTALVLSMSRQIALNAVTSGVNIVIFEMEMSKDQLAQRLLAMETGIDQARLRRGEIYDSSATYGGEEYDTEWEVIVHAIDRLSAANIWIVDASALNTLQMRSIARRLKQAHGLGLIICDYLQLMNEPGIDNRAQEVTTISRNLKGTARELQVPLIALSQLSRAIEQRQNKTPQQSDLREGGIEADADVIIGLVEHALEEGSEQTSPMRLIDAVCIKNRQGPVGGVTLAFDPGRTRFYPAEMYAMMQ